MLLLGGSLTRRLQDIQFRLLTGCNLTYDEISRAQRETSPDVGPTAFLVAKDVPWWSLPWASQKT